jgi:hypothetical protein
VIEKRRVGLGVGAINNDCGTKSQDEEMSGAQRKIAFLLILLVINALENYIFVHVKRPPEENSCRKYAGCCGERTV